MLGSLWQRQICVRWIGWLVYVRLALLVAARGDSVRYFTGFLILSFHALCLPAGAQTLHGLTIGEALVPALRSMPRSQDTAQVGNYVAVKWLLPDGNRLSARASPATGKIVFLEEDRNAVSAANDFPLPGLVLGSATLDDIRRRFGSNGIGFASNAETLHAGSLIGINCYELRHAPGVLVAFVTRLAPSDPAGERAMKAIDTGSGVLEAIMVAKGTYLEEIWGDQLLFDPHYKPIDVPGLVAVD